MYSNLLKLYSFHKRQNLFSVFTAPKYQFVTIIINIANKHTYTKVKLFHELYSFFLILSYKISQVKTLLVCNFIRTHLIAFFLLRKQEIVIFPFLYNFIYLKLILL